MIDTIMRGDTIEIALEFVEYISEDLQLPVDITGCVIWFTGKSSLNLPDDEADIQVQGEIIDAVNGIGKIILPYDKTNTLIPGNLYYDIQVTDANGDPYTYDYGVAVVYGDVTRRRI